LRLTSNTQYYETLVMDNGTKNTSAMVNNLANYPLRTTLIIECIRVLMRQRRKILLLSSRRGHLEAIYEQLSKAGIRTVDDRPLTFGYYYGNNGRNKKDHKILLTQSAKCDVVLGTYHIASEGLDIPDLNTEILATPMADVVQSAGRILRKYHEDINPVIVDLIDVCGNFANQGNVRSRYYKEEGHEIQTMKMPLGDNPADLHPFLPELTKYLSATELKGSRRVGEPDKKELKADHDPNDDLNDDLDDDLDEDLDADRGEDIDVGPKLKPKIQLRAKPTTKPKGQCLL